MSEKIISRDDAYYLLFYTRALTRFGGPTQDDLIEAVAQSAPRPRDDNKQLAAVVQLIGDGYRNHVDLEHQILCDGPELVWRNLGEGRVVVDDRAPDVIIQRPHGDARKKELREESLFEKIFRLSGVTNSEWNSGVEEMGIQHRIAKGRAFYKEVCRRQNSQGPQIRGVAPVLRLS